VRFRLPPALVVLLLASACSSGGQRPQGERTLLRDPNLPYVVSAIDYHFHDAHPSEPIALDRAVQFSNQGNNKHNVTIEGTSYDRMFGSGDRITIDPIGSLLSAPGNYPFYCKLHADRGMSGVLVLVE
jgi:hypothetical protein